MTNPNEYGSFDVIALFNTLLGLMNYEKNTAQHREQDTIIQKLDTILERLDKLEGGTTVGKE